MSGVSNCFDSKSQPNNMDLILFTVTVVLLCFTYFQPTVSVDIDNALSGMLHGVEGASISMACDLRDTDANFIWFRNSDYFLNMGQSLTANLPSDIANRVTVVCVFENEACYLTIRDLRKSDEGFYGCGYQPGGVGNRISSSSATLIISVAPAESSPKCLLFNDSYSQINPNMTNVGDVVRFGCVATDGDPDPFVYIARDGSEISVPNSRSTTFYYIFSQSDEGSTFTCVMTHPALAQPRSCIFLTLPIKESTTTKAPTTFKRPQITMTSHKPRSTLSTIAIPGPSSASLSTVITVVVFVSLFLIIMIVLLMIWFLKHKRSDNKNSIKKYSPPSSLDLKMDTVVSPTTESTDYDVVNIQKDSKEKQDESNADQICEKKLVEDDFPVYAKPDKSSRRNTLEADAVTQPCQYENISPVSNGGAICNDEDGIMYADLELSVEVSNGSAPMSGEHNDATVYADIQKS